MPVCAACGLDLNNRKGISYYPFPADPDQRGRWLSRIQRFRHGWSPDKDSVLCAAHFDFDSYQGRVPIYGLPATVCYGMKQSAKPTCNLPVILHHVKNGPNEAAADGDGDGGGYHLSHSKHQNSSSSDDSDTENASEVSPRKRIAGPSIQQMQEICESGTGALGDRGRKENEDQKSSSSDDDHEDGSDNQFTVEIFEEGTHTSEDVAAQSSQEMKPNWFNQQHRTAHIINLVRNIDREIHRGSKKQNESKLDCEREESHFDKISAAYLPRVRAYMQEVTAPLAADRRWQINHAGQDLILRDELTIPCLGELKVTHAVCPFCRCRFCTMRDVIRHACLAKNLCAASKQRAEFCDVQLPKGLKQMLRRQRAPRSKRCNRKVFKPLYCDSPESIRGDTIADVTDFLNKELESSLFSSRMEMSMKLGAVTGWDMDTLPENANIKAGKHLDLKKLEGLVKNDPEMAVSPPNKQRKKDKSKKEKKRAKKLAKVKKKEKRQAIAVKAALEKEKKRKKKQKKKEKKKKEKHVSPGSMTLEKAYQFMRQTGYDYGKLDGMPQYPESAIDSGISDFANLAVPGNHPQPNVFPVSIIPSAYLVENMSSGWIEDNPGDQGPDGRSQPADLFDADLSTNRQANSADQIDPLLANGSMLCEPFNSEGLSNLPSASDDRTGQDDSVFQEQFGAVGLTNPSLPNFDRTVLSLIEKDRSGEPFDSTRSDDLPSVSTYGGLAGQVASRTSTEGTAENSNNPCEASFSSTNVYIPIQEVPGNVPTSQTMFDPCEVGLSTLLEGVQTPVSLSQVVSMNNQPPPLAPIGPRGQRTVSPFPSPDSLPAVPAYSQPPPLTCIQPGHQRSGSAIPSPEGLQVVCASTGLPREAHNAPGEPSSHSGINQIQKLLGSTQQVSKPATAGGGVRAPRALSVQSKKPPRASKDMVYRYVITSDTLAKTLSRENSTGTSSETSSLGGSSGATLTPASTDIPDLPRLHSSSNKLPGSAAQTPESSVPPCSFSLQAPTNNKSGSLALEVQGSTISINLEASGLDINLRNSNGKQAQLLTNNTLNKNSHQLPQPTHNCLEPNSCQVQPLISKSLNKNGQAERLPSNNSIDKHSCQPQDPGAFSCYLCGNHYPSMEDMSRHQCVDTLAGGDNGSTVCPQLKGIKPEPLD